MKRISKKWIAVASVVVVAAAALVVALEARPTLPLRFLENRFAVVYKYESTGPTFRGKSHHYYLDADCDAVVEAAAQELPAAGFTLKDDDRLPDGRRFVRYAAADDESVVIETYLPQTMPQRIERVYVEVKVPDRPSLWKRLIRRVRETLGW
jgi:hypothetical protein